MRVHFLMKGLKLNILLTLSLLVSPLLTIPGIVAGLFVRNKVAIIFLSIVFGLIGFQIIPSETSDLARHSMLYEDMKTMDYQGFLEVLEIKPDFLFYLFMYIMAKMSLSPQWLTAVTVFVIVYNYLKVYHNAFKNKPVQTYLLGIFVLLLSFKWSLLFLGLRNYLAFSFVLVAIYQGIIENKKGRYWLLLLASVIHFSSIVFIPVYFLLTLSKWNGVKFRNLFFISFIFLFFTKSTLLYFLDLIPTTELINKKIVGYLSKEDIIERAISVNIAAQISFFIQFLWFYYGSIFLILTSNYKSKYRDVTYVLFVILNLFFISPDTFNRLGFVARPFLLFLMLHEIKILNRKLWFIGYILLLVLYALVDIYSIKDVYSWSLFNLNALTTLGILLKDYFINPIN